MAASGPDPALVIVVAVSDNGVIGRAGALPWHLPSDLRHVKRLTMGKPLIMGRRTYDGIGRPLPGRRTIVLTRDPAFAAEDVTVAASFDDAVEAGRRAAREMQADEVVAFGGQDIYARALFVAQRIYKTEIHCTAEGDRRFPDLDPALWREVKRQDHPAAGDDRHPFSFVVLERRLAGRAKAG